mmetsp:Transcript_2686/g.4925  ORF Transcript_2686/g.4925 Transcript_2686/m.4925 type:complete len:217 (+) Transcript_2686:149-799(+)
MADPWPLLSDGFREETHFSSEVPDRHDCLGLPPETILAPSYEEVPFPEKLLAHREKARNKPDLATNLERRTTLMVRHIPTRFSLVQAMQMWPPAIWHYDFLFVPYRPKQRRSSRYVFLNFETAEDAEKFKQQWHGKALGTSGEQLVVSAAQVQGLEANIEMHRNEQKVAQFGAVVIIDNSALPIEDYLDSRHAAFRFDPGRPSVVKPPFNDLRACS